MRGELHHPNTQGWEEEDTLCRKKEVESGLYWRYVEFQLPGDIQTEMLVKQLEIGIWNPKREVRPDRGGYLNIIHVSK